MTRRKTEPPAVWTTETLRVHFQEMLAEQNLRNQQRFEAQEHALAAALLAVEKSTQATFISAERATTKAEKAAEARFESVNEFRGQLNDLITTLMPRAEAIATIGSLASRMEATASVITDRIDRTNQQLDLLASRLDLSEGRTTGLTAGAQAGIALIGVVGTVLTIVIAIGAWT